jgi:hypothetical protein
MQIIKSWLKLIFFVFPFGASAQSAYLNQGSKEYHLIDRLQIKMQQDPSLNFSAIKPYNRKYMVQQVAFFDSIRRLPDTLRPRGYGNMTISGIDEFNITSLMINNREWVSDGKYDATSRKPIGPFYKTKSSLFEVNNKDFYLSVNPVLQMWGGRPKDSTGMVFLNSRGVTLRGRIANKIGFSSTIIENQERGPDFFREQVLTYKAVPGVGFYKTFKTSGYDYFDARGYITFNAAKFIDFQFGFDKNFIGNGFRSLYLSDWGNSYLFFKINTRIWKLNYQNLFMELMPQYRNNLGNTLLDRKYAAMHHLSINATRWLNIGLFESVVFGRTNHFDFQYLNPIIFYRHIEGGVGSADNAFAGLDLKANVARRFQFYGQLMLDEFILKKVKNDPTNWVNKFGMQLGGKYIDAFGIKNLDLQVELNRVRPFTYSHFDTIANYTHYNQPLAHPLGANFQELVGIVRYQPAPRWYIYARGIYYFKGLDTANANFGGNIFRNYTTRQADNGFSVGSGNKATCFNAILNVSYEFRENLFFELNIQRRMYEEAEGRRLNTNMINAGIRLNMFRREYDF